jgi:hypothetical protein
MDAPDSGVSLLLRNAVKTVDEVVRGRGCLVCGAQLLGHREVFWARCPPSHLHEFVECGVVKDAALATLCKLG